MAALEQSVQRSGSITHFELTIGPSNGVPTKYNKTRTIEITSCFLSDLKTYAISERRMCRLDKLLSKIEFHKGINDIKKSHSVHVSKEKLDALTTALRYDPLFISQQGKLEDIITEQPQEVVYAAEETASKQLIQLRLMELLKRIGADAGFQIDSCTVDGLHQLKQIVDSGGGKLHLNVDLPDGSHHGFKI